MNSHQDHLTEPTGTPENLAELPEPIAKVRRWTSNSVTVDIPPPVLAKLSDGDPLFIAGQMRSAIQREREKNAILLEALRDLLNRVERNGGLGEYTGGPAFAVQNAKNAIATAIRNG
jgi:hypothetical protein